MAWAILAATLIASASAQEATNAPTDASATVAVESVEVGFRGLFKVGCWTPLTVRLKAPQNVRVRVNVEVADPDGSLTTLPGRVVELVGNETQPFNTSFRSGRVESGLSLVVVDADDETRILARRDFFPADDVDAVLRRGLTHDVMLVATLGSPAGFADADAPTGTVDADAAEKGLPSVPERPRQLVQLDGYDLLPRQSAQYASLDALVIAGRYDVPQEVGNALRDWVYDGGHLIVSVGRNAAEFQKSPLAAWVPVSVTGKTGIRELSGLEALAKKNVRILFPAGMRNVEMARIEAKYGVVAARELNGPVLIHAASGFGKVTMLTVDLDQPPLSSWPAVNELGTQLLARLSRRPEKATRLQATGTAISQSGITDLATQIHAAGDYFPLSARISMWGVMGLTLAYLVVIGPIDYLLVHRVLRRPELTWGTFPVLVVLAGGLAGWTATAGSMSRVTLNQVDLLDIDADSGRVRSQSWMTVCSPQTRRYEATVTPRAIAVAAGSNDASGNLRVSWNGVPENSYGGMYRPGGFEIGRPGYTFSATAQGIQNLPISVRSTKTITAQWHLRADRLVESRLEGTGSGRLSGQIVHHLNAPIENWVLAYQGTAILPVENQFNKQAATLKPGQVLSIAFSSENVLQRDLAGYLTGTRRRVVRNKLQESVLPERDEYDPLGRDAERIIRALTFYDAAGGAAYTTLRNNALGALDFSEALQMDRAVLFGRIARSTAELKLDGRPVEPQSDGQATFVRIVLPVTRVQSEFRELPKLENVRPRSEIENELNTNKSG